MCRMTEPTVGTLVESPVQLRPDGAATREPASGYPANAWQVGEAVMSASSRHGGERHLDADELVYLIAGAASVELSERGHCEVVALRPGEAFVVPRETWHRILVDHASRLLFVGSGRTEVRPRTPSE